MDSSAVARSPWRQTLFRSSVVAALVLVAAAVPPLLGWHAESPRVRITRGELFVILACVGSGAALGFAVLRATLLLLRSLVFRSQPLARAQRPIALLFVGLGLAVGGMVLYARYVSPLGLTVRHHVVPLAGLTRPLRVVLFSDVHSDPRFPVEDRLVATINGEQPDAIFFLGDSLNRAESAERFRHTLARLRAPTKLAIRGNWDIWFWSDIDLFADTGFTELTSRWHQLAVQGVPLRVGAHAFVDEWLPDRVVPTPPAGPGPAVFLYHATDYAHVAARRGIDLYLNGDTHGGQIALPWYGPLLSIGRRGREFHRGLYWLGRMALVVTPGIGVERKFPFRFLVPPEVTVLELVPGEATGATSGAVAMP
jgi:hypothetical protein